MKIGIVQYLSMRGILKTMRILLASPPFILAAILGYPAMAFPADSVRYDYDGNGRLTQAIYQSGQTYRYSYDGAGNIISLEQSGWTDRDGDFLPDGVEKPDSCPFIGDADSDDDGIPDGLEDKNRNGIVDAGETDPCNPDTDGDGIPDGMELGYVAPVPDPDDAGPLKGTDTVVFTPDADPGSTTNPLSKDSNGNGIDDGAEDANRNGRVDAGEGNPSVASAKSISGVIYGAAGTPLGVQALVKAYSGTSCNTLRLDASTRSAAGTGTYVFENLSEDSYYILAESPGAAVLLGWYTATGEAHHCTEAQPIHLSAIPDATGRDIRLTQAASISGTILESGGAVPEGSGLYVKIYKDSPCTGALVKTALIDPADGRFTVNGISAGDYFVQVDAGAGSYQAEWWASGGDAFACANAESITVAEGATIDAIDMRLDKGGRISGKIYRSTGSTPLTGETILVEAYADGACTQEPVASVFVNETTGGYAIGGLKPGRYILRARGFSGAYIEEWWSAAGNAFHCLQAGSIDLTSPVHVTDSHFQLDAGGTISGTLFEADGLTPVATPLAIEFYQYQNTSTGACGTPLVTYTNQAAEGFYRQALPPGYYFMRVNPTGTDYAFSWWTSTGGGNISCERANIITIEAGAEESGKNLRLPRAVSLSGHLYEGDGVTPVTGPVQPIAYSDAPCDAREVTRGTYNPATGEYRIDNLRNGNFTVFVNAEGSPYADAWWSHTGDALFCFQASTLSLSGNEDITGQDIHLDTGGTISGTVYQKDGTTPLAEAVPIGLYPGNACGSYSKVKTVLADAVTGQYTFMRQGPGNYTLLANPAEASAYVDEWWSQGGDAFVCQNAESFTLAAGVAQREKNFQLDKKSNISGILYKQDGATMNVAFNVQLYGADACQPIPIKTVSSSRSNGTFSFTGVAPGHYHILVNTNFNIYASEWYSQAGDAFACTAASGVVVPSGEDVANIQIRLNAGAKISGAIHREDGVTPVTDNTRVYVYRGDPCNPETLTYVNTTSGAYEIDALQPGTYYMKTSMSYYFDRWWSQSGNAQSCADAEPIHIANVGDIVGTTHFNLKEKGIISGKVYRIDGVTPVTGTMYVNLYNADPPCNAGGIASAKVSTADGSYLFRGLDAGTYFLRAYYANSTYLPEWWSQGGDTKDCSAAEGITLTEGQKVMDRNFSLHEKGRISGKVFKVDQSPITSETIYVYYYSGSSPCTATRLGGVTVDASDGTYTIPGLQAGTYFLKTSAHNPESSVFIPEWWSGIGHTLDCAGATGIPIVLDQSETDKDFGLYDCTNFPGRALNDDFDQAIVLPGAMGSQGTNNYCTTAETGEPDHAGAGEGARASLWWRWTAPVTGTAVCKTENSSFDTVLAVYTGHALNALTVVAKNNNFDTATWSRVAFKPEKGQTYALAVDKANAYGEPGLITLACKAGEPGDINLDGEIDLGDAILVLQSMAKRGSGPRLDSEADVDADGRIGIAEVVFILQKLTEKR